MKREVWADKQVASLVNEAFIPVTIYMDDPNAATVLSRYRVGAAPSTIITDPEGTILHQQVGGMSKADFLEMLGKLNPSAKDL